VIITQEFIDSIKTNRGGITSTAMYLLSGTNKPASGWLKRLKGKEISAETWQRIVDDRDRRNKKNLARPHIQQSESVQPVAVQQPSAREQRSKITRKMKQQAKLERKRLKAEQKRQRRPHPTPALLSGIDPNSDAFLHSYEWRRVRMMVLKRDGARCACCGSTPADGVRMHVDHIKPRRLFPQLALDLGNLQVLCEICNHGKGNWDMTDWRGKEQRPIVPLVDLILGEEEN